MSEGAMGLLSYWKERRAQKAVEAKQAGENAEAYRKGKELGGQIAAEINRWFEVTFNPRRERMYAVLRRQAATIFDNPGEDPREAARIELRLFWEQCDVMHETIKPEMVADLYRVLEVAETAGLRQDVLDAALHRLKTDTEEMKLEGFTIWTETAGGMLLEEKEKPKRLAHPKELLRGAPRPPAPPA